MKGNFLKIIFKYGKQNKRIKEPINVALEIVSAILKNDDSFIKFFYFISNWHSQVIFWQRKSSKFNILIKFIPFQSVLFSIYTLKKH